MMEKFLQRLRWNHEKDELDSFGKFGHIIIDGKEYIEIRAIEELSQDHEKTQKAFKKMVKHCNLDTNKIKELFDDFIEFIEIKKKVLEGLK